MVNTIPKTDTITMVPKTIKTKKMLPFLQVTSFYFLNIP